jgi:hypothetical protein
MSLEFTLDHFESIMDIIDYITMSIITGRSFVIFFNDSRETIQNIEKCLINYNKICKFSFEFQGSGTGTFKFIIKRVFTNKTTLVFSDTISNKILESIIQVYWYYEYPLTIKLLGGVRERNYDLDYFDFCNKIGLTINYAENEIEINTTPEHSDTFDVTEFINNFINDLTTNKIIIKYQTEEQKNNFIESLNYNTIQRKVLGLPPKFNLNKFEFEYDRTVGVINLFEEFYDRYEDRCEDLSKDRTELQIKIPIALKIFSKINNNNYNYNFNINNNFIDVFLK